MTGLAVEEPPVALVSPTLPPKPPAPPVPDEVMFGLKVIVGLTLPPVSVLSPSVKLGLAVNVLPPLLPPCAVLVGLKVRVGLKVGFAVAFELPPVALPPAPPKPPAPPVAVLVEVWSPLVALPPVPVPVPVPPVAVALPILSSVRLNDGVDRRRSRCPR